MRLSARSLAFLLVSGAVFTSTATAQMTWIPHVPANSPSIRTGHAMAYDAARGVTVMFGGLDSVGSVRDDTWEWNGADWTLRSPATVPPQRHNHRMVYDSARERIVMFGGLGAVSPKDDTWEWDGNDWILRSSVNTPDARQLQGMAYDVARQRTVMHGGLGFTGVLTDTWEWNGVDWDLRPSTPLGPLGGLAMAYDAIRGETVLFGGGLSAGTYVWNGFAWSTKFPTTVPPARNFHTMAFHAAEGRIVMHGGVDTASYLDDTWAWNGTDWIEQTPTSSPAPRSGHASAYDAARERMVMFGGVGVATETWEYAVGLASFTPFGTGCVGSLGVEPTLLPEFLALPWTGTTFRMTLGPLPPGGFPNFVLFGSSNTTLGGVPLPLDLTVLGMTGCRLLVDTAIAVPLATGSPTATWEIAIPADLGLVGSVSYVQGWVTDPAANPFGAVLSQGGRLRIGTTQ